MHSDKVRLLNIGLSEEYINKKELKAMKSYKLKVESILNEVTSNIDLYDIKINEHIICKYLEYI